MLAELNSVTRFTTHRHFQLLIFTCFVVKLAVDAQEFHNNEGEDTISSARENHEQESVGDRTIYDTIHNLQDGDKSVEILENELTRDIPIIIWWSGRLFPFQSYSRLKCGSYQCYATNKRKHKKDQRTRGFILYGTDIVPDDLPLPRKATHEWALLHEESPMNNHMLVHKPMLTLFNHTGTFQWQSDFPITSQHILSLEYLTKRKPLSISLKNEKRAKGFAPIMFVQSHCSVSSDRDRYVEELMKHIDVDSYGQCVKNKDLPSHLTDPVESMFAEGFHDLIAQYKFTLAFENAICDDYMTEKLYRPLHVGSVPIYMGSHKANKWVPSNQSVIFIDNFSTPKDLADFVKFLDEDDNEYEKYLQFKNSEADFENIFLKEHLINRSWGEDREHSDFIRAFECHVCKTVAERYEHEKQATLSTPPLPPKIADSSHLRCPQPYTSIGDPSDYHKNDK